MEPHFYDVAVSWKEGRIGELSSSVLNDKIITATPPQFPKGVEGIWSPEHFFVAAINSCLMTTFLSIAENSKLEFADFTSDASGKLEMVEGKLMMSEVMLNPVVTILHEADIEKAERILHKSESACLISNSVKSKIVFQPKIQIKN